MVNSTLRRTPPLCVPADDFESKFQFHPVEDLPPPEEFKPFPRIYPSKENRGRAQENTQYIHILCIKHSHDVSLTPPLFPSLSSEPQTPRDQDTPQMSPGLFFLPHTAIRLSVPPHDSYTSATDVWTRRVCVCWVYWRVQYVCIWWVSNRSHPYSDCDHWPFSTVECFECVWEGGGLCPLVVIYCTHTHTHFHDSVFQEL